MGKIVIHHQTETLNIKIYDQMENKLEPTVGAWVHITSRYHESVATIDKIGKIHFTVDSTKYSNIDGYMAGRTSRDFTRATVITEEQANELKAKFSLNRKGYEAKTFIEGAIKTLSPENAINVMEFIKSLEL